MARISTYGIDSNITEADQLIGTDADNNNKTKNITVGGLKTFMEENAEFNGETTTFSQNTASMVWNVTHNLDKYPSVTTVDSTNDLIVGDVVYNSSNSLTINFSSSISGKAYLN